VLSGRYRLITDFDDDVLSEAGDELYIVMDSLAESDSCTTTIQSVDVEGRFIQVIARDPAEALVIRYRRQRADAIGQVAKVDILAAYQAVLQCVRQEDAEWRPAFEAVAGSRDEAGVQWARRSVDYAPTGLSIATAMLDLAKRRQRVGLPGSVPLPIRWGHREVITGDTFRGIPAEGRLLLRASTVDGRHRHGVEIRLPQGAILEGGEWLPTGGYFWPGEAGEELDLTYRSPHGLLQLSNVYTHVVGNGQERVFRWEEHAGMWSERVDETTRVYHCNHASTVPATFDDLVFSVTVIRGSGGAGAAG
jgi:hypothetical protein